MVSDDVVEAFARDGVVVVRGVVSADELGLIAQGVERVVDGCDAADGETIEALARWGELDEIGRVALRSGIPKVAAELMDSPSARFYHDHIVVVPASDAGPEWHQDQPMFNVHGRGITAWIPVDRVPKKGSPEFWAGSHRGPWRLDAESVARESRWFPEGTLAEIPDVEDDRSRYDIRRWDLDPGDVVFYDFATVNTAPGRPADGPRRVLGLRYLSADARYATRPWPTVPAFPGLDRELAEGAEFDHPYFPLAWPR